MSDSTRWGRFGAVRSFRRALYAVMAALVVAGIIFLVHRGAEENHAQAARFEAGLRAAQAHEPALSGLVIEKATDLYCVQISEGALTCNALIVGLDEGRPNVLRISANFFAYKDEWIVRDVRRFPPAFL